MINVETIPTLDNATLVLLQECLIQNAMSGAPATEYTEQLWMAVEEEILKRQGAAEGGKE